jgi:hypothetical protein
MARKSLDQLTDIELEATAKQLADRDAFVGEMSRKLPGPAWDYVFDELIHAQTELLDEIARRQDDKKK